MAFNQTTWPARAAVNNLVTVAGRWAGGGSASNMTKVSGTGISSVAYNSATGAYIITFNNVGGTFLGAWFGLGTAGSTSAQTVANWIAYSATAKTLTIFITDVATPTAKDLATTETLNIMALWADTAVP